MLNSIAVDRSISHFNISNHVLNRCLGMERVFGLVLSFN